MAIAVNCPSCRCKMRVPDTLAGRKAKCPKCGHIIAVPAITQTSESRNPIHAKSMPQPAVELPSVTRSISAAGPGRGAVHSLGIGSMVLGIVALLFSFIPCIGVFSMPLSGLGLLLGIIGTVVALRRSGRGIGFPIAGSAINGMALLIAFFWIGLANVAHEALDERKSIQSLNQVNATSLKIEDSEKISNTQSVREIPQKSENRDKEKKPEAKKEIEQPKPIEIDIKKLYQELADSNNDLLMERKYQDKYHKFELVQKGVFISIKSSTSGVKATIFNVATVKQSKNIGFLGFVELALQKDSEEEILKIDDKSKRYRLSIIGRLKSWGYEKFDNGLTYFGSSYKECSVKVELLN